MDGTAVIEAAVAKGVALLDREVPNWRSQVNAELLVMRSSSSCIIGQIFGGIPIGYWKGLAALKLANSEMQLRDSRDGEYVGYAGDYGFTAFISDEAYGEEWAWDKLEELWRAELLSR